MINYNAFHKLSYGLYIICSEFEGTKAGYAGNTAFQVTSSPSTIAISCNKNNFSCGIIQKKRAFSVSVLERELEIGLVGDFGFKSGLNFDKFSEHTHKMGVTGVPILTESCDACFECNVTQEVDCGTHILFIGEVVAAELLSDKAPLTYDYYHEHYKMRSPKNAPTYIEPEKIEVEKPEVVNNNPEPDAVDMSEHICIICGYSYDPYEGEASMGIPADTPFADLPDDFVCPICRAGKEFFNRI